MTAIVHPTAVTFLVERDPLFQEILERYGPPPPWRRPAGFVTLARLILEQQVSLASGEAAYHKLAARLPQFTPEAMLMLDATEFRTAGVSRQKTVYLQALSSAIATRQLDLDRLAQGSAESIREQLMAIKGIGEWTATVYLLLALQHPDVFPMGDVAAINALREWYPAMSTSELAQVVANWSPFRSTAVYFLWHFYLEKRQRKVFYE